MTSPARLREIRWNLPYGVWTLQNGDKVLFNRRYRPIALLRNGASSAVLVGPNQWIRGITDEQWFYHDGHTEREKWDRATKASVDYGFAEEALQRARKPPPITPIDGSAWRK